MKNILMLLIVATTLFSCSSSDNNDTPIQKTVKKVVFYKNSANEKHWIITNNLLTSITNPDGTVVEKFIYDSQNRVINDIKYTNGVVTESNTITYNTGNTINSIDGLPYSFNASTRTYTYSYGSDFTIDCQVNQDMLAIDFVRMGSNAGEYHMTYANGNMTSFKKLTNGVIENQKNFHFDANFGSNPIYNAVLAVARVKSLTDPNFFADCQVSLNMANGFDKGSIDPYYYNYGEVPSEKITEIGVEILDNNNSIGFYSFVDYYFE